MNSTQTNQANLDPDALVTERRDTSSIADPASVSAYQNA